LYFIYFYSIYVIFISIYIVCSGSVDSTQSPTEGPVASLSMFAESPSCDLTKDTQVLNVENNTNTNANLTDIEYNLLTALPVETIRYINNLHSCI